MSHTCDVCNSTLVVTKSELADLYGSDDDPFGGEYDDNVFGDGDDDYVCLNCGYFLRTVYAVDYEDGTIGRSDLEDLREAFQSEDGRHLIETLGGDLEDLDKLADRLARRKMRNMDLDDVL
jgi:hypothetical protein